VPTAGVYCVKNIELPYSSNNVLCVLSSNWSDLKAASLLIFKYSMCLFYIVLLSIAMTTMTWFTKATAVESTQ